MKFEAFDLAPALVRAVAQKGYHTATPIQAEAIPPILGGRDLVGCAQTGTGKTAAFALPTLHRMLESIAHGKTSAAAKPRDPNSRDKRAAARRKTRTLVLAPTRELCSQIAASFAAYGTHTPLRYAVIYGGVSQTAQVRALQHGVDAIIATPGRLLDLLQQGHVELGHVEILILDEADQMLDMGFIPDLRRIVARVPKERQTLMFSATMPDPIRRLASEWLRDPATVQAGPASAPVDAIAQSVYFVDQKAKPGLLQAWIEKTPNTRTLVFARTKRGADNIVKHLLRSRIFAAAIHGNKSQSQRERTLAQFKSSRPPVLVATDIASRGLDIAGVSHVVNYDLPAEPEIYVHRIGRTGRAGATGAAVSFCTSEDVAQLRSIERLTRRRIDVGQGHPDHTLATPPAPTAEKKAAAGRGRGRQARPKQGRRSGAAARPARRPAVACESSASGATRQRRRRRHSSRV